MESELGKNFAASSFFPFDLLLFSSPTEGQRTDSNYKFA